MLTHKVILLAIFITVAIVDVVQCKHHNISRLLTINTIAVSRVYQVIISTRTPQRYMISSIVKWGLAWEHVNTIHKLNYHPYYQDWWTIRYIGFSLFNDNAAESITCVINTSVTQVNYGVWSIRRTCGHN